MTHPAYHTLLDSIEALEAAIETAELSIIQRQVLRDMRDDLRGAADFNTFSDVVELANKQAARGYY